jgi:hypothetical protein
MAPPKIRIRGARSPIPQGYILGRSSGGTGEVQLLNIQQLRGMGIATHADVKSSVRTAGFGFYAGGLLKAGELLGTAVYSRNVTWLSGVAGDAVTSLLPAHAPAVFTMVAVVGGSPTTVGTITFAAGSMVGVVAWTSGFVLVAGAPLKLYAPAAADSTLADISGVIVGTEQ